MAGLHQWLRLTKLPLHPTRILKTRDSTLSKFVPRAKRLPSWFSFLLTPSLFSSLSLTAHVRAAHEAWIHVVSPFLGSERRPE